MKCFDLQVNGAFGVEFSDPGLTESSFLVAVEKILARGVTRFLPAVITSPPEVYERNLALMSSAIERRKLDYELPGFHLEGPFINPADGARGAHNRRFVLPPSPETLQQLNEFAAGKIRLITAAPELPNFNLFADAAHELNIKVSLGHSLAGSESVNSAHADALTHLGNGIPNLIDRHRNPIWSGLADDRLYAMIVADGHHLPPEVVKCIVRCKGMDKVVVTSDASGAAGLPPGRYRMLGNDAVLEPDGKFWNPVENHLVGSAALLPDCVEFLRRSKLASDADISELVWKNPHRLLEMPI